VGTPKDDAAIAATAPTATLDSEVEGLRRGLSVRVMKGYSLEGDKRPARGAGRHAVSSRLRPWRPALHEFTPRAAALLRRGSFGWRAFNELPMRVTAAISRHRRRSDHSDGGKRESNTKHKQFLSQ